MQPINRKVLKSKIREKFGSLKSFCKVSNTKYKDALRILNTSDFTVEEISEMQYQYRELDANVEIEGFISVKSRNRIRITILTHFNSYTDFCKKHYKYDVVYITNVVKGNLKRESKKYKLLIELLKREYEL